MSGSVQCSKNCDFNNQNKSELKEKWKALLDDDSSWKKIRNADSLRAAQQALLPYDWNIRENDSKVKKLGVPRAEIEKRWKEIFNSRAAGSKATKSNRIVSEDAKWVFYDIPNYTISSRLLPFTKVEYSWLLIKPLDSITNDRYRLPLTCLSRALREKRPQCGQTHDEVPLLHEISRPHLKTLKWKFKSYPPYFPDIVSSGYWLLRWARHNLTSQQFENAFLTWLASKRELFSWDEIRKLSEWYESVRSQRSTIVRLISPFILFWNGCIFDHENTPK